MIQQMILQSKYKSLRIEPELMKSLKRFVASHPTKEVAAEKLGFTRMVLHNIIMRGTCNSDSLEKIQSALQQVTENNQRQRVATLSKKYIDACCKVYGVEESEIFADGKQDGLTTECKFMAIYVIRLNKALTRPELCILFKLPDTSYVNKIVKTIESRIQVKDRGIHDTLKEIISLIK